MMRKVKIQILSVIVLFSNILSMQGMFPSKARQFKRIYRPVKTDTSAASKIAQPVEFKDVGIGQKLQNWYRNFLTTFSSSKPIVNKAAFNTEVSSPFSTGIQTRAYSNLVPQQQPSFFAKVLSYFELKKPVISEQQQGGMSSDQSLTSELRDKGIGGIMHELLYPQHTKKVIDRAGLTREIRVFDENDLEKAKEKIGRILALNEDYKTSMVLVLDKGGYNNENLRTEDSEFRTALLMEYGDTFNVWDRWGNKVVRYGFEGTILDEVLYRIFSGESSTSFYTTADNLLNYIKLAHWLIDQGVKINENNAKKYMIGYVRCLMEAYKRLYEPESFVRDTLTFIDEDAFKKIFEELDPILEKLLSTPELKQELHQVQKERQEIEANPQEFREKLKEEAKRQEYIRKKGDILQWDYIFRTGDMSRSTSDFYAEVQFDEAEYQEWKKTGFLRGEQEELERQNQQRWQKWEKSWEQGARQYEEQEKGVLQNEISNLKKDLKISPDASIETVLLAVKNYFMENHPDRLKNRKDISPEQKKDKADDFAVFMGEYDEIIKTLRKRKQQDEQNRE